MAFDLVSKKRTARDWSIGSTVIMIVAPPPPRSFWKPVIGYTMVGSGGVSIFKHFKHKKEGIPTGGILATALGIFLATRR